MGGNDFPYRSSSGSFSTFFVALAGQSRMVTDALMISGALQDNRDLRLKLIKALGFILPILCVICYASSLSLCS